MQIIKIAIYGKNGKVRELSFETGKLNIITGRSKTGKSVIGDIIDYCFGGSRCNIAVGVVRDTSEWYGLLLEHRGEIFFVARQNPPEGQASTNSCRYQFGLKDIPKEISTTTPIDSDSLEKLLSKKIQISENLFVPPEGQTRDSTEANIRHTLYYCLQGQDEIAAKSYIFHRQNEPFMAQAIKDTLPYFLGVIDESSLELTREKRELRREERVLSKKIEENKLIQGSGLERAMILIEEAKAVGLIKSDVGTTELDYKNVRMILRNACQTQFNDDVIEVKGMDRISYLQTQIYEFQKELDNCSIDINNANDYLKENDQYSKEVGHQINRLNSIGLFDELDFEPTHCPFCSSELQNPLPFAEEVRDAVRKLSSNLGLSSAGQPHIDAYLSELQANKESLESKIHIARQEINAIYEANRESLALKELNERKARVIGRISLWLESVIMAEDTSQDELRLETINNRIKAIDDIIGEDALEERKQSMLSRIASLMSKWAKELQLEHSDYPYRLDLNKLTVIVDKERPVPLDQLGSGSNWLGCHLITLFALHTLFVKEERPVPHFVFIDQPSQVYFPSENDENNVDSEEVRMIYKFIRDRIAELNSGLQIIIVDHANINEDFFQDSIVENWWENGQALIPANWIDEAKPES